MQTFLPIHQEKSLEFLVKVSPLPKAHIYHINDLCKASYATLTTYNKNNSIIL